MATDPAHGVVDANCTVHGVQNLHVASCSVFPTSGVSNPTFTMWRCRSASPTIWRPRFRHRGDDPVGRTRETRHHDHRSRLRLQRDRRLEHRSESMGLLAAAVELGIRHFDVARSYGSGDTEAILGDFLATTNEPCTVTSKCGITAASTYGLRARARRRSSVRRCAGSRASTGRCGRGRLPVCKGGSSDPNRYGGA